MGDAKPGTRTIELVRPPDEHGVGVFCISADRKSQFYVLREIPCEIGGRGFAVHRLGMGTLYHVRVGKPEDCECECLGWLRWGRCKHVAGLMALVGRGLLPRQARMPTDGRPWASPTPKPS